MRAATNLPLLEFPLRYKKTEVSLDFSMGKSVLPMGKEKKKSSPQRLASKTSSYSQGHFFGLKKMDKNYLQDCSIIASLNKL